MGQLKKFSVSIRGHRTSYTLEQPFADELNRIALKSGKAVARIVAEIDAARDPETNLASAIRLQVLGALRKQIDETSVHGTVDSHR